MTNSSWYQNWHNNPRHPHVHWVTFLAICLMVGIFLTGQINKAYINFSTVQTVHAAGPHDYFNSLVARSDHYKSYSLRNEAQIAQYRQGNNYDGWDVEYIYPTDPDPRRQDAAKVRINDFIWHGQAALTAPMSGNPADTLVKAYWLRNDVNVYS